MENRPIAGDAADGGKKKADQDQRLTHEELRGVPMLASTRRISCMITSDELWRITASRNVLSCKAKDNRDSNCK
jgi:hypothetical protein